MFVKTCVCTLNINIPFQYPTYYEYRHQIPELAAMFSVVVTLFSFIECVVFLHKVLAILFRVAYFIKFTFDMPSVPFNPIASDSIKRVFRFIKGWFRKLIP